MGSLDITTKLWLYDMTDVHDICSIFDLLSILKHKLHNDTASDESELPQYIHTVSCMITCCIGLPPPVLVNDPNQMTVSPVNV